MSDLTLERRGDYDASNACDSLIFRHCGIRLALFAQPTAERIGVAVDGPAGEVACFSVEPQVLIDVFRNWDAILASHATKSAAPDQGAMGGDGANAKESNNDAS